MERNAVDQSIARRAPVILQSERRPDGEIQPPPPDALLAVLAVPLLHEGRVLGGMGVVARGPGRRFTTEDMEVMEILASSASTTLVGLERVQLLQRLAETDALTGLSNRHRATALIQQFLLLANRQQVPVSVAILDLDHFKLVNDRYGHDSGDMVLRKLAELLTRHLRSADVISRWGGEEFLVGLYGMSAEAATRRLSGVLQALAATEFALGEDRQVRVTFSAGVAASPLHGDNLQDLYRVADAALYQAKEAGRSRVLTASGGPS